MINAEIKPAFHQYLGGIVRGLGGVALAIGGIHDHVHLLVKIKPTACLADFIRDLKSNSSVWAKKNGIRNFAWQRRYGAFTVSESNREVVVRYIREQEQHHGKFDYKHEFETLLSSNGITIDDFVWQE
jgi:hypothetical protein